MAGFLALKYGRFLAVANAAIINAENIDFHSAEEIPQQSSATAEELPTNAE